MQIETFGQFKSGLRGVPIPQSRSIEQERRLVRWLNDERETDEVAEKAFKEWAEGRATLPELRSDEDAPARKTILIEFLPRLRRVQAMPKSAREALAQGRAAMKTSPGKYANEDDAASEESGVNDRARLIKMLRKHTILPTIPSPGNPALFLASGDNLTEIWAMHLLIRMASDGTLAKLVQCGCGCEKWLIKKRGIDRFASDACKVRFHQSGEEAKKLRAAKARATYRLEKKGIVMAGKKSKGRRKHGKA